GAGARCEVDMRHVQAGAVHRAADPVEVDVSGKGIGRSHRSGLLGQLLHHRLLLVVVAPTCSFGTPTLPTDPVGVCSPPTRPASTVTSGPTRSRTMRPHGL